jgi:hypothetical protein
MGMGDEELYHAGARDCNVCGITPAFVNEIGLGQPGESKVEIMAEHVAAFDRLHRLAEKFRRTAEKEAENVGPIQ